MGDTREPDLPPVPRACVGEFGGYAVLETDDLAEVEKAIATYAVFQFRLEPVLDVADAVAAQAEGIAWRESNAPS